jgi:fluoride exporter
LWSNDARTDEAARGASVFSMLMYALIGLGSGLGGLARYGCSDLAAHLWGEAFPWGTFLVNVVGSFVIGAFNALAGPDGRMYVSSAGRQFVMTGVCGGYTTFSSFSLQTFDLLRNNEWVLAGSNIVLTMLCCLAAVWAGHMMASNLNVMRRVS